MRETVTSARGGLPLLAPMSEVAGKIATQAGAFFLEKPLGGRGILLGGVPGVAPGKARKLPSTGAGTYSGLVVNAKALGLMPSMAPRKRIHTKRRSSAPARARRA